MMSLSRDFGYILHKFLRDGCYFVFKVVFTAVYIFLPEDKLVQLGGYWPRWMEDRTTTPLYVCLQCQNPLHQETLLLHSKMFISFCWFLESVIGPSIPNILTFPTWPDLSHLWWKDPFVIFVLFLPLHTVFRYVWISVILEFKNINNTWTVFFFLILCKCF